MKNLTLYTLILLMSLVFYSCGDDDEGNPAETVDASFTSDQSSINIGESIQFTDNSTGNPTSWEWTFEGGTPSSSNLKDPIVTYKQAGTLNVTLRASNDNSDDTAIAQLTVSCDDSGNDLTFSNYTTSSVQYGTSTAHQMTLYIPEDDLRCSRPAINLMVGGGVGSPNSLTSIQDMAIELVNRGYVVSVSQYRSGPNDPGIEFFTMMVRNTQDYKAGIRYLHSRAADLRLDTERIFGGGHGSGGIITFFADYVTYDELNEFAKDIVDAEGGLEGNQGNPGFSGMAVATFTTSGASFDTVESPNSIDANEPPLFVVYGEFDTEIDPDCTLTGGGSYQCGGRAIYERAQDVGLTSGFFMIVGGNHSSPRLNPELYMDQVHEFLKNI